MSKEDILLSIEELEKKNTELAEVQVALSKDIEKIHPMLNAAEGRLSVLNAEIAVVEKRIAEKEAQRNESLNIREENIKAAEEIKIQTEEYVLSLNKKQQEIDTYLINKRLELDEKTKLLDERQKNLEISENILTKEIKENKESLESLIADEKRLSDLRSFVETQQTAVNEKEINLEARAEALALKESALVNIQSLLDQREEEFRKRDLALVDAMLRLSQAQDDLKKRENIIKAREEYTIGEIKIIDEERKKLQLGWLQINKKIQEKQIDIELKELQK
jgi:hypothetical protein